MVAAAYICPPFRIRRWVEARGPPLFRQSKGKGGASLSLAIERESQMTKIDPHVRRPPPPPPPPKPATAAEDLSGHGTPQSSQSGAPPDASKESRQKPIARQRAARGQAKAEEHLRAQTPATTETPSPSIRRGVDRASIGADSSTWPASPAEKAALQDAFARDVATLATAAPTTIAAIAHQAFGDKAAGENGRALVASAQAKTLSQPKNLRFAAAGSLGEGNVAAYSPSDGGTVVLDERLKDDPAALRRAYAEEAAHHLDHTLGGGDAVGDEGEIFQRGLEQGQPLADADLRRLRASEGSGRVVLDGKQEDVEFRSPGGGPFSSGRAGRHQDFAPRGALPQGFGPGPLAPDDPPQGAGRFEQMPEREYPRVAQDVYNQAINATHALGEAVRSNDAQRILQAQQHLDAVDEMAQEIRAYARQRFGAQSHQAQSAQHPLDYAERGQQIAAPAVAFARAETSTHRGERQQALTELAEMASTDGASDVDKERSKVAKRMWATARAKQDFAADPAFDDAIKAAEARGFENTKRATEAMDAALFSTDPQTRREAISTLEQTGTLSRGGQIDAVKADEALRTFTGDGDTQATLDQLQALAGEGNRRAETILANLPRGLDAADPRVTEALRQSAADARARTQSARTDFLLEGLSSASSAQVLSRAEDRLRAEAGEGNDDAAAALERVDVQADLARLREGDARAAQDLRQAADDGNPYARLALSTALVADQSDRVLDAAKGNGSKSVRIEGRSSPRRGLAPNDTERAGAGDGERGVSAVPLAAEGAGPVDLAANDKAIGLPDLPPEAKRALKLEAAKALAGRDDLSSNEAFALATASATAHAAGDVELAAAARNGLRRSIDRGSRDALVGLRRAIDADTPGSTSLVDTYLSAQKMNGFDAETARLKTSVLDGGVASTEIFAHLTNSDNASRATNAARSLVDSASNGNGDLVTDALLRAQTNAPSETHLRTLGRAAAESTDPQESSAASQRDQAVRERLRAGLREGAETTEHQGAAEGMAAIGDRWQAEDIDAMTTTPSAAVNEALSRAAPHLDAALAARGRTNLREQLSDPTRSHAEASASARALGALGHGATEDDVRAIVDRFAGRPNNGEAAKGLTNLLSRAQDPTTQRAAANALVQGEWGGLDATARKELVAYVRGSGDPVLQKEVSDLIYDANIRPPVSGLIQGWGVSGTPAEVRDKALAAVSHYGEDAARDLAENAKTWNALSPTLRAEVLGLDAASLSDAQRLLLQAPVDIDRAATQMANGTLHESSNAFLLGDLDGKVQTLAREAGRDLAALEQKQKNLEKERARTLADLTQMTEDGVSFFDRLGHASSYINPAEGFGFYRSESNIDRFAQRQGNGVRALQQRDRALEDNATNIVKLSKRKLLLDSASGSGRRADAQSEGNTRWADRVALEAWEDSGDALQSLNPQLYRELMQPGETPQTWSAWQRLKANGVVKSDAPEQFSTNADARFTQALSTLDGVSDAAAERSALRNHALHALDSDPAIQRVTQVANTLARDLPTIQKMLQSGAKGTRYEDFVAELQSRAEPVKAQLDALRNDESTQKAVRDRIGQLGKLRDRLRQSADDPRTLAEVEDRIHGLTGMLEMVQSDGVHHALATVLDKSETHPDTFGNWLQNEGPKVAGAIAVGVTAAATITMTMGAAAPLWGIALAGAAGGMVGYEAMASGMHHMRNNFDSDVTSGRRTYRDNALLDQWRQGERAFDAKTGQYRERDFFGDVATPYAKQLARDFVMTYATLGIGRGLSAAINKGTARLSSSFLTQNADRLARVQSRLAQVEGALGREGAKQSLGNVFKHLGKEMVDEVGDTALETVAQKSLERIDARLGVLAGVLVSTGKGINLRTGSNASAFEYDGAHEAALTDAFRKEGFNVQPLEGTPGGYRVDDGAGGHLDFVPQATTAEATRPPESAATPLPPSATTPQVLRERAQAKRDLAAHREANGSAAADVDTLRQQADALDKDAARLTPRGVGQAQTRASERGDPTTDGRPPNVDSGPVRGLRGPKVQAAAPTPPRGQAASLPAAPDATELSRVDALIEGVPLADQHAHEIGSTPDARVGGDVAQIRSRSAPEQQQYVRGLEREIDAVTKGGAKAMTLNGLADPTDANSPAFTEVIASPRSEDGARQAVSRLHDRLSRAANPDAALEQQSVLALGNAARAEIEKLPAARRQEMQAAVDAAVELASTDRLAAKRALEQHRIGVLNQMHGAAQTLVDETATGPALESAEAKMQDSVLRLRNAARLRKPDEQTWGELDGDINGGLEFFQRYKSILGSHGGRMDGPGVAEVARGRRSQAQGELGYQEVRADLDTDRFSRRFVDEDGDGMLNMDQLAERSRTFADAKGDLDANMVYALTKREVQARGQDRTEAEVEAPAYAQQATDFVDAYFERGPDGAFTSRALDLQSGISGLDHGGRESADRQPMLFAQAHGKRTVHNAMELQRATESARQHQGRPSVDVLIRQNLKAQGLDPDLANSWQNVDAGALDTSTWKMTADGRPVDMRSPEAFQRDLAREADRASADWSLQVGPMSVEQMASVNRAVHDALRTHAALQGTDLDVTLLGATNHTGEQIRSVSPDVLLDQVDQSLAMGIDRLGHGVILGSDMHSLYESGPAADGNGSMMWPTMLPPSKRTAENAHLAKTKEQVDALENRRQEVVQRAIAARVPIEVNMTSNLVINNQTPDQHAIHQFREGMREGLRLTVNTDDETILDTSTRAEMRKVQGAAKMDAVDTAKMMLEGYDSRLGGRALVQREALVQQYDQALSEALLRDDGNDSRRVQELAKWFGVPYSPALSPRANLQRVIGKVMR